MDLTTSTLCHLTISTASAVRGGTTVITPSEDSVGDVKMVCNSYDAESGRFSGAQIQVTSKAGTTDFPGESSDTQTTKQNSWRQNGEE